MGLVWRLYMQWKALRLPWRRDVLAGADFDGNMYFERFVRGAHRPRRLVVYRERLPLSEYSDTTIPVQWQAWMRHTRAQPPALAELAEDARRRERVAANVEKLARAEASVAGPSESAPALGPREQHQQLFQKAAPGERFQPENWGPAAASGADRKDRARRDR
ncbi:hypothetical protein LPJ61_002868 [Coemansia biformis]|uniref:NADH dehydrogenase [ubiquinone] 1 alpha subcomplex subunit n=1 Tax=Coemansia biformis TaxID=1286918 RepID=A0A9W7YCA2_9FUNG|nr:hypothetical protein LPJ61_002868 [Coemansia biformis]